MIRDITLGQYYPTESVLHHLDPRVKIGCTMLYVISLFFYRNPYVYLLATVFLVFLVVLSRVPVSFLFRGFQAILFLLLFTVAYHIFFTPGEPIVELWKLKITREGLKMAGYTAIRLIYLIVGSSLMTLTTTPNQLTDGLERMLGPLRVVHVPVHEIAMMMSIALRFIPILLEETDKIMKAQIARGADFESGNLLQRVRSMVPLLVPLFVSAFRRATDLAMAMEARCYRGGSGRTKMKPLVYGRRDVIAYVVMGLYLVLLVLLGQFTK